MCCTFLHFNFLDTYVCKHKPPQPHTTPPKDHPNMSRFLPRRRTSSSFFSTPLTAPAASLRSPPSPAPAALPLAWCAGGREDSA